MNKMIFDFNSGELLIDGDILIIDTPGSFKKSNFFNKSKQLKKNGIFYFYLDCVEWMGEPFFMEIRPSVEGFHPSVFLINKSGGFFDAMMLWEKRADLNLLRNEEARMSKWIGENIENENESVISMPPHGTQWVYEWGNIAVQSNTESFDCGIYITWI